MGFWIAFDNVILTLLAFLVQPEVLRQKASSFPDIESNLFQARSNNHSLFTFKIWFWNCVANKHLTGTSEVFPRTLEVGTVRHFSARHYLYFSRQIYCHKYSRLLFFICYLDALIFLAPISQNGQTHSNNSSPIFPQIVWVCLTILWDWRLKG